MDDAYFHSVTIFSRFACWLIFGFHRSLIESIVNVGSRYFALTLPFIVRLILTAGPVRPLLPFVPPMVQEYAELAAQ